MKNILIIEDDEAVAEAIRFVLDQNGYTTAHAANGTDAAKLLSDSHFCCALIDVWLAGEDGLEVLANLRAAGNNLPVIVISGGGPGQSLETVSTRADVLNASAMLFKPFSDEELLNTVTGSCTAPDCDKD